MPDRVPHIVYNRRGSIPVGFFSEPTAKGLVEKPLGSPNVGVNLKVNPYRFGSQGTSSTSREAGGPGLFIYMNRYEENLDTSTPMAHFKLSLG